MSATPPSTDQRLPESEDIGYTEPPKSLALYVDATKWIVGLATGSFLLTGSLITNPPAGRVLPILAGIGIFFMAAAAGAGVRALQAYTRLANLIEVQAVKKPFEVAFRSDGYQNIRWVTQERVARCKLIEQWLTRANLAYEIMTASFAAGLVVYLAFGGTFLAESNRAPAVAFSAAKIPNSPILGAIHDDGSHSDCIVVRTRSGVTCWAVARP
jgi:hypothetical protein